MRLVYTATQKPVQIGDTVTLRDNQRFTVDHFAKPHKPDSEGKVALKPYGWSTSSCSEYFVSVIGAEWIEREDRANLPPVRIVRRSSL